MYHCLQWMLPANILGVVLTPFLTQKFGKRNIFMVGSAIVVVANLTRHFIADDSFVFFTAISMVASSAMMFCSVCQWGMVPDTVEYGEWKTGVRTESSLYGFMTFAQKAAIAFAALLLGIILTQIGFEPNSTQSEKTLYELKFVMTWIPLAGIFLSFVLVSFYPIDKTYHQKLIFEIENKKLNHETN